MTTYIVKKQEFSEKALRKLGNGYTWKPVAKSRSRPPTDEIGFHDWLWFLVNEFGAGKYHVIRTHERGESKGFKPVCMCSINQNQLVIERGYGQVKSHPGFNAQRQAYFKNVPSRSPFRSRA